MDKFIYLLLLLPAFISALTIHEFAHAWAGHKLGDDTAERQGRLTLDPMVHLDPLGSLLIVVAILFGAPLIGWAKPVPFNPRNLSNPRRDSILIAIAGPISNLIQAAVWLALLFAFRFGAERAGVRFDEETIWQMVMNRQPDMSSIPGVIATILTLGVLTNIGLAAFNMIPIPPLDGHYVLEGLGPPFITDLYNMIRPWSFFILLLLIQTPILFIAMKPFMDAAKYCAFLAFGFPPQIIPLLLT